jgi:PAS domain S-box-containing protein
MNKHNPKILIVDDEPVVTLMMGDILKDEGYDLFFAVDGQDGLAQALSIHPDLIFLDMCMPVLDGVGFLRELNEQNASICPVIVLTGLDDDLVLSECFDQGIFSVIRKPFHSSEIIALCRRYTRLTEIKKRLFFNRETVAFLGKQASSFGLDSMEEEGLIEALPLPLFVKNREGVLVQVNKALEDFTGLSRKEMVGKTCGEISQDRQFVASDHESEAEIVEDGGLACIEQVVTDRSGQPREVIICRSVVINGGSSQPVAILGVMIDITEFLPLKRCWCINIRSFQPGSVRWPIWSGWGCAIRMLPGNSILPFPPWSIIGPICGRSWG